MTDLMTPPRSRSGQRSTPPAPKRKGRWDIQGLRAFAVLAVIADHLFQWPNGGFVGVDVFFVISGFLITGLLLREHESSGHISWTNFYRRRFKRIMPAAVMVLLFTVLSSYYVFNATRADAIRTDATWGLLFSANWRFLQQATDYFNADGPVSPLQHYWSLSVEEQFYFVWPWLMLLIFTILLRRNRSRRAANVVVFVAICTVTALSFWWALKESVEAPNSAYFSTFTRTWELGVGATLAVCVPLAKGIPDVIRPALAWIGLIGMTASLWIITPTTTFPAPGALLPVLATALVIAAGTHRDPRQQARWLFPLTNRASNYVGDISYSLYLWHFPIIVLGAELLGDDAADKAVLLVALATMSVFAYHLVERPLHQTEWVSHRRRADAGDLTLGPFLFSPAWQRTAVAFLGVVTIAVSVAALAPREAPRAVSLDIPSTATEEQLAEGPAQTALTDELTQALQSTSWPDLTPSMDESIDSLQAPPEFSKCGTTDAPLEATGCSFGSTSKTAHQAAIIGDSVSMTFASPLTNVLSDQPSPWNLTVLGTFGCPFRDVDTSQDVTAGGCESRKAAAVAAINEMRPDVLFVVNSYWPTPLAGSDDTPSAEEWASHLGDAVGLVRENVGRVVFIAAPPSPFNPAECYTPRAVPADCSGDVPNTWRSIGAAEQALATTIDGRWVDSEPWFCAYTKCPSFAGETPIKSDLTHMTVEYGEKITPVLAEAFAEQEILKLK